MNKDALKKILTQVYENKIKVDNAIEKLKHLPYENLEFARIDTHREIRQSFPEAIFCAGKTTDQILAIIEKMLYHKINVLATRAKEEVFEHVLKCFPDAKYNKHGQIITIIRNKPKTKIGIIAVVTAGTSDIPVAEEARETLNFVGFKTVSLYDVGVAGIHRLFDNRDVLFNAKVIITVAGMDGALPSVIAGLVNKPIIAVPSSIGYGANFGGVSALLSMLNSCAPGLAVVNIDNGFGAARLACMIMQVYKK
ncbi:MAG: nickel pincer cofactor biosynthesis protein LarB [Candidatus Firestonebacteria bacterium]|nr:nickel pincer cofactor biosynthesis protein LarB [Candidatus Firestonebacteria bacterium]